MDAVQVTLPSATAPVMQAVAERDADVGRAQHLFAETMQAKAHRQGREGVGALTHAEQGGVDSDGDGNAPNQQRRRRDKKDESAGKKTGWRMGVNNDGQPHLVNLVG
ncbi:MAG: hypothetical protein LBP75_09415 [Planctomycetota bacterium]|jgi:hypothetical protein|nr:hypothetical protein [Planctomycetota bacterium]